MLSHKSYKHRLFKKLIVMGRFLDLTHTQYKLATLRYKDMGEWLADGKYCLGNKGKEQYLKNGYIYPQGSIRLETAVKPLGQNEFDIDLVFFTPNISSDTISPEFLKKLIGDRLKEHTYYRNMLKETNRGWSINYPDEFHLDITPSLEKQDEPYNTSELVADSKLKNYMTANPQGYSKWFDYSALQIPICQQTRELFQSELLFKQECHVIKDSAIAIEDLPEQEPTKLLLKSIVQIFKRHRDIMFEGKDNAPISVIITTLTTKSYLYCIKKYNYTNEYDLMLDTLRYMKKYIDIKCGLYWIENPSIQSENFAEKWNEKSIKKRNFDQWHDRCIQFFNKLSLTIKREVLFDTLEEGFGKKPTEYIRASYREEVEGCQRRDFMVASIRANIETPMQTHIFYRQRIS